MIRTAGNVLLGLGFGALAVAALLRDPVALDANIGAGVLTLVGIPVGALGLVMIAADLLHGLWSRTRERRREL